MCRINLFQFIWFIFLIYGANVYASTKQIVKDGDLIDSENVKLDPQTPFKHTQLIAAKFYDDLKESSDWKKDIDHSSDIGNLNGKLPPLPRPPGLWGKDVHSRFEIDRHDVRIKSSGEISKRDSNKKISEKLTNRVSDDNTIIQENSKKAAFSHTVNDRKSIGVWNSNERKREALNGPPGLWGRDMRTLNGPPGLWGRSIKLRSNTPALWDRDMNKINRPPGLWGRDVEKINQLSAVSRREIENINFPPGLWGRELTKIKNPPGLWGRDVKKPNIPSGLKEWVGETEKKTSRFHFPVMSSGISKKESSERSVIGPPGLWGRELETEAYPPGLWGREVNLMNRRRNSDAKANVKDLSTVSSKRKAESFRIEHPVVPNENELYDNDLFEKEGDIVTALVNSMMERAKDETFSKHSKNNHDMEDKVSNILSKRM